MYGGWSPLSALRFSHSDTENREGGGSQPGIMEKRGGWVRRAEKIVARECPGENVGLLRKNCAKSFDFGVVSLRRVTLLASYAKIVPNLLILVWFLCTGDTFRTWRRGSNECPMALGGGRGGVLLKSSQVKSSHSGGRELVP